MSNIDNTRAFYVRLDGTPVMQYRSADGLLLKEEELDPTSELCRNIIPQLAGLVPLKDKMQLSYLQKIELQTSEIKMLRELNETMSRDIALLKDTFGMPVIYSFRHPEKNEIKIGRCMDNEAFLRRKKEHERSGYKFVDVRAGTETWESHVKKQLRKNGFNPVGSTGEYFPISESIIKFLISMKWPLLPPSEIDPIKWWSEPYQATFFG